MDDFYLQPRGKFGRRGSCKICINIANKQHERPGYRQEYYASKREYFKIRSRQNYAKNKERASETNKRWRETNREKTRGYGRKKMAKKRSTPQGHLSSRMSAAINLSIHKGSKKRRHWELLVGYTIDQLKAHLEKQFSPGMSWANYGSYWEIDHKIPIRAFNFTMPEDIDFKRCWTLNNLQPLEKTQNRTKSGKLSGLFQPSLAIPMRGAL